MTIAKPTPEEKTFMGTMFDIIISTAEANGYDIGGGSHPEEDNDGRGIKFSFYATKKESKK